MLNNLNNFVLQEPAWRALSRWPIHSMPQQVVDWLLEPNSLTVRMKNTFDEPFNVNVLGQGLAKPLLADARYLNQRPYWYALIREVLLNINNQPFVFARTTLPRKAAHHLQELTHLGDKPLGEVIFSDPRLKRVGLDLAKIGCHQLNLHTQKMLEGQSHIWARRNAYQLNKHVFLVSEFFLPALFNQ